MTHSPSTLDRFPFTAAEAVDIETNNDNVGNLRTKYGDQMIDLYLSLQSDEPESDTLGTAEHVLRHGAFPDGFSVPNGNDSDAATIGNLAQHMDANTALYFEQAGQMTAADMVRLNGAVSARTRQLVKAEASRLNRTGVQGIDTEKIHAQMWSRMQAQREKVDTNGNGNATHAEKDGEDKNANEVVVPPIARNVSNLTRQMNIEALTMVALARHPRLHRTMEKSDGDANDDEFISEYKEQVATAFELYKELIGHQSITNMQVEDIQSLYELCFEVVTRNDASVLFTVAIGGSESDVNVRFPSYLVPALRLLSIFQRYHSEGRILSMPRLRVLNGMHIGAHLNNYDTETVLEKGREREQVAERFFEEFCPPNLAEHIFIEDDSTIDIPTESEAETMFAGAKLTEIDTMNLEQQAARMVEKGRVATHEEAVSITSRYTAAHPRLFLDSVPRDGSDHHPDFAVSIGGMGEAFFMRMRKLLTNGMDSSDRKSPRRMLNFNVRTGTYPPYYNHDLDVPMHEVNGQPIVTETVREGEQMKRRGGNPMIRETWVDLGVELLPWVRECLATERECDIETVTMSEAEEAYRSFCKRCTADLHLGAEPVVASAST